ncbi:MAG: cell division FtsZ family protein [Deltaproteobacteria bacterium]|jgi:cell division protein FtsZ|nr:cell division FtsZ family protein [Deltaproteobacteria bacterium]
MEDDFEFVAPDEGPGAVGQIIRVFGIGGCGNKTVDHLIRCGNLRGVEFVSANSDPQDLKNSLAPTKILLGVKTTKGKGCGGKPERGRQACLEAQEEIKRALAGTDLLFITAGMGGGTGSGGAPVVAEAMSNLENPPLIVSVVTTPFSWERNRVKISDRVITELTSFSNCIITVANAKIETHISKDATMDEAMAAGNEVLLKAVSGIIELLTREGRINLDFADVESVLDCRGPALMGFGEASGDNRGKKALQNAVTCPLMTDHSIKGAKRLLVNIVSDENFLKEEFTEVFNLAAEEADPDGEIFGGWAVDPSLNETGTVRVTVIATGIDNSEAWAAPDSVRQDDVIDLDTLAVESDVNVRADPEAGRAAELAPARQLPLARQIPAPPAAQAGPALGTRQLPRRDPSSAVLGAPAQRRKPGYQAVPAQATRYEANAGVDPVNQDSKFYDTPTFFRNKAN